MTALEGAVSPGRKTYERYRDRFSCAGIFLPEWVDLPALHRDAWECAARGEL